MTVLQESVTVYLTLLEINVIRVTRVTGTLASVRVMCDLCDLCVFSICRKLEIFLPVIVKLAVMISLSSLSRS